MNMLEISGLKKSFGIKEVIKDVKLTVPEHTIYGFVGENGAGKTTTMKMILGLLKMDAGSIRVNEKMVSYGDTSTNKYIGYLPDVPEFYSYMTPREYLRFCGDVAGVESGELNMRIEELLERVGLANERHRIKGFSRGMKQRLGIAQALIHKPKLLICDEPTSALDPIGRKEILDILVASKEDTTVLFSTHILSDVERICDEVAFLHDGSIVLSGTIEDIKRKRQSTDFEIALKEPSDVERLVEYSDRIHRKDEYTVMVKCGTEEDINPILRYISESGMVFETIKHCEITLENMFLEVAKR